MVLLHSKSIYLYSKAKKIDKSLIFNHLHFSPLPGAKQSMNGVEDERMSVINAIRSRIPTCPLVSSSL